MAEAEKKVYDFFEERMMKRKDFVDTTPPQVQSTGVSKQEEFLESFRKEAQGILGAIKDTAHNLHPDNNIGITKITFLPNKELKAPLEVVVERDGEAFLARTLEIPLYGQGGDVIEAVNVLKYEIESLYDDLMEDDNFSDEWLRIKEYLKTRISDR